MAHIEKRGPNRYRARHRGPDNRERSRTFTRRSDAERWLALAEADKARGRWVDPALTRTPFSAWATRWEATIVHLKPKTMAGYQSLLRSHILPTFGPVELGPIDSVMVREWIAGLQARGLSASRIRQARQVLSSILQAAVEAGYIGRNPTTGVKAPRPHHREMRFLSALEVEQLVEAMDPRYQTLVYLLAYGGLRWGEAIALRVGRCDLLHSRVEVVESLAEVNGHFHSGEPKTYQKRSVAIPRFLRDHLATHLATVGGDPRTLVFVSPEGTPLRSSNFARRVWAPALQRAGLPSDLRPHDMRHTAASLAIARRAHPKEIQALLGHSSITVTFDRYGHLFPSMAEELAKGLDETHREAVLQHRAASTRPDEASDIRNALRDNTLRG